MWSSIITIFPSLPKLLAPQPRSPHLCNTGHSNLPFMSSHLHKIEAVFKRAGWVTSAAFAPIDPWLIVLLSSQSHTWSLLWQNDSKMGLKVSGLRQTCSHFLDLFSSAAVLECKIPLLLTVESCILLHTNTISLMKRYKNALLSFDTLSCSFLSWMKWF